VSRRTNMLQELKRAIGSQSHPVTYKIHEAAIEGFTEAIEDPNMMWQRRAHLDKIPASMMIAPPTFLRSIAPFAVDFLPVQVPMARRLDAGSEWEFLGLVFAGDCITALTTLVDVYEKKGKVGDMLFTVNETRYVNQRGEMIAMQRCTLIRY
jgi:acyl dehydratase